MDFEQDNGAVAWRNFVGALSDDNPRLESFVRALYAPLNALQRAMRDSVELRWLDVAVGQQLDGIGDIVGQPRYLDEALYTYFFGFDSQPFTAGFGQARIRNNWETATGESARLNDEEYRKVLYWKIAVNNGHGTAPEIAAALRGIFGVTDVRIKDVGNAKMTIWIDKVPNINDPLLNNARRWIPKLAGVGVQLLLGSAGKPFGFAEQGFYGFGVGSLSMEI